jgi:4-hydroxy-3-methylbut-2-enyl diphosphate reductase
MRGSKRGTKPGKIQRMKMLLANPRGFCAGVDRAIEIVERALRMFGAPIYVRHEVVHNRHVVERLRDMGAVFVEELEEVPSGATVVFSAHGVSTAVEREAAQRGLQIFDATCPLVSKVHMEVARNARDGRDVILIGHHGHPEVEGTMGRFDTSHGGRMHLVEDLEDVARLSVRDAEKLAFVTQTTLSVDDTAAMVAALRERFPSLQAPRREDICYATQNRQDAVKNLLAQCDLLIVVGSRTSSNSNRLRELADRAGIPGYLVDDARDLKREWLEGRSAVGVTAGASAPEVLVQQVIDQLRSWGVETPAELAGIEEKVIFGLPRALRAAV